MKPCPNPNCNSTDVAFSPFAEGTESGYVLCHDCALFGPTGSSEEEAIAEWDNLPRKEAPKPPLTLEVNGQQFNISFSTNGPVTFCHIVYRDEILPAHPTFTLGSALCHPNDPFDFATGEKLAMRDACKNLGHWFYISGRDPRNKRMISHALYSAYRSHLREQRGEWPFKQPEPATIDIAELIE